MALALLYLIRRIYVFDICILLNFYALLVAYWEIELATKNASLRLNVIKLEKERMLAVEHGHFWLAHFNRF